MGRGETHNTGRRTVSSHRDVLCYGIAASPYILYGGVVAFVFSEKSKLSVPSALSAPGSREETKCVKYKSMLTSVNEPAELKQHPA